MRRKFYGQLVILITFIIQPITSVSAETIEELDALAEVAVDEQQGIVYAQQQAAGGAYLEAIGTLERVLALFPKSNSARLLHAVYLCQIDDQLGGAVELKKLKKKNFSDELWTNVLNLCSLAEKD